MSLHDPRPRGPHARCRTRAERVCGVRKADPDCPKTIPGASTRRCYSVQYLHQVSLVGCPATADEPARKRPWKSNMVVHFVVSMPAVGLWMHLILWKRARQRL